MTEAVDFSPLTDEEWPSSLAALKKGFAGRLNVYRTMAHHPALVLAWEKFRNHVVLDNVLGPVRSEIVILRTGYRSGSAYEWEHHLVRGRACGLTDARMNTIRGPIDQMETEDRPFARAVDELIDGARLRPESIADIAAYAGRRGVLDVIATVGMYLSLSFIANSFDVPIDAVIPTSVGR